MIRKLFCKHTYHLVRKIYGDEIILSGFNRSIWKCDKCKKVRLSKRLETLVR